MFNCAGLPEATGFLGSAIPPPLGHGDSWPQHISLGAAPSYSFRGGSVQDVLHLLLLDEMHEVHCDESRCLGSKSFSLGNTVALQMEDS